MQGERAGSTRTTRGAVLPFCKRLPLPFTMRVVMVWSKNSSTLTISAGPAAAQRAQTGSAPKSTSQRRPLVGSSTTGTASRGSGSCGHRRCVAHATPQPHATPSVGAKSASRSRSRFGRSALARS